MIKVVFFDFNNTLMDTTTPDLISDYQGKNHELKKLEQLYKKGKITKDEKSMQGFACYQGFSLEDLRKMIKLRKFVWNEHVKECLDELHKRHIKAVIITNEDINIMKELCKHMPFDNIKGSVLEMKDKKYTGKITCFSEPKDIVVRNTLKELGCTKDQALAVGDSPSDAIMFKEVGAGVLYKPDLHAKGMGDYEITDFMELLEIIDNYNKKGC